MIWPFKKKTKEVKIPEFKGVHFTDLDGTKYEYRPRLDIKPYEVAMLLPLFMTTFMRTDRFVYIKKHKLNRHFVPVVTDE